MIDKLCTLSNLAADVRRFDSKQQRGCAVAHVVGLQMCKTHVSHVVGLQMCNTHVSHVVGLQLHSGTTDVQNTRQSCSGTTVT